MLTTYKKLFLEIFFAFWEKKIPPHKNWPPNPVGENQEKKKEKNKKNNGEFFSPPHPRNPLPRPEEKKINPLLI